MSLTGGDPVVRGVGRGRRGPAWRSADGRTVALTGLDAEDRVRIVVVLGEPDEAAEMALAIRHEVPAGVRLTVPRGAPLPLDARSEWNFRATREAPPPQPAEDRAAWHTDDKAITELLRLVSPGPAAWPGDETVRRWAIIRDGDAILACLADTSARPGVGQFSSIAVHPDARGRGLGSSITAWAMRRLFAEGNDIVALGVYADNRTGIRMYDRLGFTIDRALTSGVLKGR